MTRILRGRWLAGLTMLMPATVVLAQQPVESASGEGGWGQWLMLLFVIGMGLSVFHSIKLLKRSSRPDSGYWLKRFEQACLKHDPSAASQALLFWAKAVWGGDAPTTLPGIAARVGLDEVSAQLKALQQATRSGESSTWNAYLCRQVLTESLAGIVAGPAETDSD
ncbi:MAG: hypothetical protein ABW090_16645 [Sedimenticola sp.]